MPISIYIILLLQLIVVAIFDWKKKKIANLWVIVNLIAYVPVIFIFSNFYLFSFQTFFFSFVFLFVGYIGFLLKLIGAGDTKYLFGLYPLIPIGLQEQAFLCLAYTTVLVGGILFLINTITNFDKIIAAWRWQSIIPIKRIFGKKFSFAPVILLSWIIFGWQINIFQMN